jgi:hypothetical protein
VTTRRATEIKAADPPRKPPFYEKEFIEAFQRPRAESAAKLYRI